MLVAEAHAHGPADAALSAATLRFGALRTFSNKLMRALTLIDVGLVSLWKLFAAAATPVWRAAPESAADALQGRCFELECEWAGDGR